MPQSYNLGLWLEGSTIFDPLFLSILFKGPFSLYLPYAKANAWWIHNAIAAQRLFSGA